MDMVEVEEEEEEELGEVKDKQEEMVEARGEEEEETTVSEEQVPHVAAPAAVPEAVLKETPTLVTKPPGMLTNLPGSPVSGTGLMENPHISAWSRAPAPGKTSTSPKPTIERLTSSKKMTRKCKIYMNCYTLQTSQK